MHYSGKLNVKFMVQARQFRKTHEDAHYAGAQYRYQREFAIMFREHSVFVSADDKHRLKVGEPGFPVAAAERGRRVLVGRDSSFSVGDHDFTRFSLVPSVTFVIDIPDCIDSSWYKGQVIIGFKDAAFEPSSPIRHAAELHQSVQSYGFSEKPVLFLYSDGGPDHRLTYLSVKLSLVALFLKLDLDFLCACRTAPFHSWRNPVERVMSVVNMGLQSVGIMRQKMSDEYEASIAHCNNLSEMRKAAERYPTVLEETLDSLSPVKVLLSEIMMRLKLKEKSFLVAENLKQEDLEEFFKALNQIDSSLQFQDKLRKDSLKSHPSVQQFLDHCCRERHYLFCIKKCGDLNCGLCKPPRLPLDVFSKICFIPDPIPGVDGHYLPFEKVYGTETTEKHRPSQQTRAKRARTLPFIASIQHAKNTQL